MGDTMREAFDVAMSDRRLPREDDPGFTWAVWRLAHEAGRQLGMEQARREERERIAQLVDPIANDIAAAIRNS